MPDGFLKYSSTTVSRTEIPDHFVSPFNHFRPHRLSFFIEYAWFRKQCLHVNFDLVHSSYYNLSKACLYLIKKGIPHVITVHDLIHELLEEPDDAFLRNRLKILKNANAIITVSENTKQDLMKFYKSINENKIHVIHHGIKDNSNCYSISDENIIKSKFILYVGHREGYKNFESILPVMQELRKSYEIQLIVVGSKFTSHEKATVTKYGLDSDIINLGQISDNYLDMLYAKCLAFAYTSLHEGFGYPLIEAMSRGAIPIALEVSCIPEVLGTAGILVKPDGLQPMAKEIAKLIEEKDHRKKLKNHSLLRSRDFSIQKQIQKTKTVYEWTLSQGNVSRNY